MKEYAALIKLLLVIGAASALFLGGCYYGVTKTENASMKAEQKAMNELAGKLEEERQRANGLNEQIRTLLDRPAAKDRIREIVRDANQSCTIPIEIEKAIGGEIDRANDAISGKAVSKVRGDKEGI